MRGEVTVRLHTDDPVGRFVAGARLRTEAPAGATVPATLTVRSARRHRDRWLLGFEEIPDRTGAEQLRGTRLLAATPGQQDGWYEEQLTGIPVEGPDGRLLGTVSGLRPGPAQDLLVLDLVGGRTASVPFVAALVPVVDVPGHRIVVDPPPGLLDLEA